MALRYSLVDEFREEEGDLLDGLTLAQISRPLTPSSSAALNGGPFDKTLSNVEYENMRKATNAFNATKEVAVADPILHASFHNSTNPYEMALKFLVNSSNYQDPKFNSFVVFILNSLERYLKTQPSRQALLDDNLRMVAFNLTSKNVISKYFEKTANIFRFAESPHLFEARVRMHILSHRYKEAAVLASRCELFHPDFFEGFLLPLTFMSSFHATIYDYLTAVPQMHRPYLQGLDALYTPDCTKRIKELIHMRGYQNIRNEDRYDKLLSKFILNIRKRFQIEVSATPNTNQQLIQKALEYMIKQFATGELVLDVLDDHIKENVTMDDITNQSVLITKLLNHNLGLECVKWMAYFKIEMRDLPEQVQNRIAYAERNQCKIKNRLDAGQRKVPNKYTINPQRVETCFVSNASSFERMLSVLSQPNLTVLAMDLEWKPTYSDVKPDMALMQLATSNCAFVIDRLTEHIPDDCWTRLGRVFSTTGALKLAFGCREDLNLLISDPVLKVSKSQAAEFVDVCLLWQLIDQHYKKELPFAGKLIGRGLKDLVSVFLGKNLDKRMQMSNWALRPLRPEQIEYAAADAYCLVEVFEVIGKKFAQHNVDMADVIDKYRRKHFKDVKG